MRTTLILAAAVFALAAAPAFADGYGLDAKGKCHDAHGKFVKASFCEHHLYKLDSKGNCHDEHGKLAAKGLCHK